MVTFVPKFVNAACADAHRETVAAAAEQGIPEADGPRFADFEDAWLVDHPSPTATLADVVAHCEHVREVAGIDHIGLGGDYDGVVVLPVGLEDVSTYPALLGALADRGWSADDLAKLTCRNTLRVMRDVQATARELQGRRGPSLARIEDLDGVRAT
jgi:membrane dipeptidase